MAGEVELQVGRDVWALAVPPEKAAVLRRAAIPPVPATGPREQVRAALEAPFGFEPLRRALTPDDRVTVVLDADLPHAAELLSGVLDHLGTAGIGPAAVTVVTPPNSRQDWIDELPDEFADVTAETHDPVDRTKLAYLATTKAGRRVYLNRTLVEADFIILLTGRGYDPLTGYAGAEAAVFPTLADDEAKAGFAGQFSSDAPGNKPNELRAEAGEIAWLLGTPFLVQVILGAGGTVQDVIAGLLDSGAEGIRRQDARWGSSVADQPDTVIASVSGEPGRVSFLDLAKAAACAARVVRKGGRVAVLTDAAPTLGEGAELLRRMDGPKGAYKQLEKAKPDDWAACFLWAFAAKHANIFLASGYPDEVAEELFATPIRTPSEVLRLIDAGESVLVIPDAHRSMITVE
jgi:nickel-dependent lactate racemase